MHVERMIAADPAWSHPSPSLGRTYLCGGTTIALLGHRGRVQPRELSWLHAALTAALGRPHGAFDRVSCQVQDFSLIPWDCQSGWAAVWWSERDAEDLAGQRFRVRLGPTPVELALGPIVRVHAPPDYARVPHRVTLTTRSPVVIASTTGRSRGALARGEEQRKIYRTDASAESLEHALCGVARKLGVSSDGVRVHVVEARASSVAVERNGRRMAARGWVGAVGLVASPAARWLLECAARGLGLGGRVAFGCGRVEVG